MLDYSPFDRRTFLRRGAMGAGAVWAASFAPFMARRAEGAAIASPYGAGLSGQLTKQRGYNCCGSRPDFVTVRTAGPAT